MADLNLITVPNPKLRLISARVQNIDKETTQFITDLGEKLVKKSNPPGVGLSAVQVGVNQRILVTYLPPKDSPHPPKTAHGSQLTVYVNPVITAHSDTLTLGPDPKHPILEGCLSIPSVYGPVLRYDWIDVEVDPGIDFPGIGILNPGVNPPGIIHLEGFSARVFQHEFDHFEGILFTDHILKQNQPLYFDNGHELIPVANPRELIHW